MNTPTPDEIQAALDAASEELARKVQERWDAMTEAERDAERKEVSSYLGPRGKRSRRTKR